MGNFSVNLIEDNFHAAIEEHLQAEKMKKMNDFQEGYEKGYVDGLAEGRKSKD